MTYTIVLLLNATRHWFALPCEEKDDFVAKELHQLFKKHLDANKVKLFDNHYTHATISDFLIVETDNVLEYTYLLEAIKESTTFGAPLFSIKELAMGVDNHFQDAVGLQYVA